MKNFKRMIAAIMVVIAAVSCLAIPESEPDTNADVSENAVVFYAEA